MALEDWLNSDRKPLLIDIRKAEKYALSHIPTARSASTVADVEAVMQKQDTNPPAPLFSSYCAVLFYRLSLRATERSASR